MLKIKVKHAILDTLFYHIPLTAENYEFFYSILEVTKNQIFFPTFSLLKNCKFIS